MMKQILQNIGFVILVILFFYGVIMFSKKLNNAGSVKHEHERMHYLHDSLSVEKIKKELTEKKNKQKIIPPMEEHIINIAYDRKNGQYVAYNVEHKLFGTGICVETACDAYRDAYLKRVEFVEKLVEIAEK
jgi:hypothetical protein